MIPCSHWGMFERFGTPNATTLAVFAEIEAEDEARKRDRHLDTATPEPSYDSKYLHG